MEGRATSARRGTGDVTHQRALAAPVHEVFASIQGEGLYVGEPQVFLRLAGCPLRCRWCDTPGSWGLPARAGDDRAGEDNWVSPFQAATLISQVERGPARTVSVTGGEPLLWPDFVRELSTYVSPRRVHLETAGAHPSALEAVLDAVDHVSLDLKLPADLDAPVPLAPIAPEIEPSPESSADWAEVRARCLELVRDRDACGKLVVTGAREPRDYLSILEDVVAIAPALPLVVQPVTPLNGIAAPSRALIRAVVELALERGLSVRVVPQVHRMLRLP